MKHCNACNIRVATGSQFCPLCGTDLQPDPAPAEDIPVNEYPDLSKARASYNFVRRLLLFLTILGCGLSLLINLLVTPHFLWCLIVIAVALYCWLTIPPMLRRGVNYAKQVLLQVCLTAFLVIALDFIIGYRGWSVSYVLPGLLCAGILSIFLMVAFNRTNWAQYVLYQVLVGVFGFIPLLLYFLGIASNLVLVLVTVGLAFSSLLITIFFGDRTIKSEFKKRFHI